MSLRPCIECGELGQNSRCTDCQTAHRKSYGNSAPTEHRKAHPAFANRTRWKKLSQRLRRAQPWCDLCGREDRLTLDHIIPIREAPQLAYDVANLRVLCIHCNSERGDTPASDDETAAVHARLDVSRPGGLGSSRHAADLSAEAKFPSENGSQL